MTGAADPAEDLALQIRAELSEPAPEGFHFADHLIRQDEAWQRTAARVQAHPDSAEVERALTMAIERERDGWTLLKLLELVDRVQPVAAAPALIQLASSPGPDERSRYVAGRACEVLLKLPLDVAARSRANEVCKEPLSELARLRLGAEREQSLQRPRRIEWLLLVVLALLALAGLLFAAGALERR